MPPRPPRAVSTVADAADLVNRAGAAQREHMARVAALVMEGLTVDSAAAVVGAKPWQVWGWVCVADLGWAKAHADRAPAREELGFTRPTTPEDAARQRAWMVEHGIGKEVAAHG